MNRPKIFENWNAAGSHLDMQAFTPHSPLSAQAGTGEGEQAGLEFWDGNQKWCHSEGTGGKRGWEKASSGSYRCLIRWQQERGQRGHGGGRRQQREEAGHSPSHLGDRVTVEHSRNSRALWTDWAPLGEACVFGVVCVWHTHLNTSSHPLALFKHGSQTQWAGMSWFRHTQTQNLHPSHTHTAVIKKHHNTLSWSSVLNKHSHSWGKKG